jgi:hypothetical protein
MEVYMCGGNCKGSMLCPFSLGIAIGLVMFFGVLIWSLWVLHYGVPASLAAHNYFAPTTLSEGFVFALLCLIKGFLAGFFIAIFYDLCRKCKRCCCKKDGKMCGCGCGCTDCKCTTPSSSGKM